jgi:hypothetical protein
VVSISQRSEELGLSNLVQNFTISNPGLKAVCSKASPGCSLFLRSDDWGFLKEGVNAYILAPMTPLHLPDSFRLHIYSPNSPMNTLGPT